MMEMTEGKKITIPSWVSGVFALAMVMCGSVAWAYTTFVTIRERDLVKSLFESQLSEIKQEIQKTNAKIDRLIERGEKDAF